MPTFLLFTFYFSSLLFPSHTFPAARLASFSPSSSPSFLNLLFFLLALILPSFCTSLLAFLSSCILTYLLLASFSLLSCYPASISPFLPNSLFTFYSIFMLPSLLLSSLLSSLPTMSSSPFYCHSPCLSLSLLTFLYTPSLCSSYFPAFYPFSLPFF